MKSYTEQAEDLVELTNDANLVRLEVESDYFYRKRNVLLEQWQGFLDILDYFSIKAPKVLEEDLRRAIDILDKMEVS